MLLKLLIISVLLSIAYSIPTNPVGEVEKYAEERWEISEEPEVNVTNIFTRI